MSKLSEQSVKELQQILTKEYGRPVDYDEAERTGTFLVNLYTHIASTSNIGYRKSEPSSGKLEKGSKQ